MSTHFQFLLFLCKVPLFAPEPQGIRQDVGALVFERARADDRPPGEGDVRHKVLRQEEA